MKTKPKRKSHASSGGFTLIELLVAMAIFLIISGVGLRLFVLQQRSATLESAQVGLNLSLRNAITQLQIDISNAGSNYLQNVNISNWPLGISIVNNVVASGDSCYDATTKAYGPKCFDQINVISAADPSIYPALIVTDSTGGTNPSANCSYTSDGYAYAQAASATDAAAKAALFLKNDQILFLKSDASKLTTVVLTDNATAVGSLVKFTFNATNANGTNTSTNDPLNISTCGGDNTTCSAIAPENIGDQFCANDYIIKLTPISYVVCAGPGSPSPCDTSTTSPDIQDPKLYRIANGQASIVMEQVIGFKVGASILNTTNFEALNIDTSSSQYNYDASTYTNDAATPNDLAYDFTAVRSVRVSLIARTTPNTSATYTFRNSFDQGPYQVQGISVAVDARNMSMND